MGIYAVSVEVTATLAVVTGARIKNLVDGIVAYGGSGGYYQFHDKGRKIHIWYGNKIA